MERAGWAGERVLRVQDPAAGGVVAVENREGLGLGVMPELLTLLLLFPPHPVTVLHALALKSPTMMVALSAATRRAAG